MPTLLSRLARLFARKSLLPVVRHVPWDCAGPDDSRRHWEPTAQEHLGQLRNTVFACASINAAACAAHPPKLYVTTQTGEARPRCLTRALDRRTEQYLRKSWHMPDRHARAHQIEEVLDHPLLTLLRQVNALHTAFDLWELTTFYQEIVGSAFWALRFDDLGVPNEIWLLPAHQVTPGRHRDSRQLVDYYEHRTATQTVRFAPEEIVHFRYPDPRDPYLGGLSPLRACWDQAALTSEYLAFKRATWENNAVPGVIISPDEVLGEEERDRLETQWNAKFRRGGIGRALVAESGLKVSVLSHRAGDLAALAEYGKTKEDIANAFHVPLSFLTSETNLANLQAADHQHMAKAILPRLRRRDQKLNEQLVPRYDPNGRLFLASDDPVPANREEDARQLELDLKFGIRTINEVRLERGLDAVAWGNTPWLPVGWAPTDFTNREAFAPDSGRTRNPRAGMEGVGQPG